MRRPFKNLACAAVLLCAVLVAAPQPAAAHPENYVIVASPDVEESNLTWQEVRDIFLFEKTEWQDGRPLSVLLSWGSLGPGSFLLEEVCRLKHSQFRRLILVKLNRRELQLAPKVVGSDSETVAFVAAGSGLLALVDAASVGERPVKVLLIDGRQAGMPGYRLTR